MIHLQQRTTLHMSAHPKGEFIVQRALPVLRETSARLDSRPIAFMAALELTHFALCMSPADADALADALRQHARAARAEGNAVLGVVA